MVWWDDLLHSEIHAPKKCWQVWDTVKQGYYGHTCTRALVKNHHLYYLVSTVVPLQRVHRHHQAPEISDYLSTARKLAASQIWKAQAKYKKYHTTMIRRLNSVHL